MMSHAYTIKKTLLMSVAIATVAAPLVVFAAAKYDAERVTSIPYYHSSESGVQLPEHLYERIKAASREMCGFTEMRITAHRLADIEACYEGTLDAAVERLDDPTVKALHDKEVAGL